MAPRSALTWWDSRDSEAIPAGPLDALKVWGATERPGEDVAEGIGSAAD